MDVSIWKSYIEKYFQSKFPWKYFKNNIIESYIIFILFLFIVNFFSDFIFTKNILPVIILIISCLIIFFCLSVICFEKFSKIVLREEVNYEDAKYAVFFLMYIGFFGVFLIYSDDFFGIFWGS